MADDKKKDYITTPEFRVAFADQVHEPKAGKNGGKPKYSLTMLFPKKGRTVDEVVDQDLAMMKKIVEEKINEKWSSPKLRKAADRPWNDGDEVEWDGFEDMVYVRASTLFKPEIIDRAKQPIDSPEEFYSGCYARASVNAFSYDVDGNKGASIGLRNLQFLKNGESFSGRGNAADDYDDLEDEESTSAGADSLGDLG